MLVLNRRCQQSVVITGDCVPENVLKVTVLKVHGGRIKLGLEVPSGIRVRRQETWEANGGAGQPCHPDVHHAASKQESDRWEDDGGGPGLTSGVHGALRRVISQASCHR